MCTGSEVLVLYGPHESVLLEETSSEGVYRIGSRHIYQFYIFLLFVFLDYLYKNLLEKDIDFKPLSS